MERSIVAVAIALAFAVAAGAYLKEFAPAKAMHARIAALTQPLMQPLSGAASAPARPCNQAIFRLRLTT